MKKDFYSIFVAAAVALLSAFSFSGCSAEIESTSEFSPVKSVSRSLVENEKTISSELNPGYGQAVFFTGDFNEGKE